MLHPIAYVATLRCGPADVDVETAVDTYADKLAGRRRRFDMSVGTLSAATLRDVDDTVRALSKAMARWLVDIPLASTAKAAESSPEATQQQPSDEDNSDDDDLIITAATAPKTTAVRAADNTVRPIGTFASLFGKAEHISGPALPDWEALMRASAAVAESTAGAAAATGEITFSLKDINLACDLDAGLFQRLEVERFDEQGLPKMESRTTGRPMLAPDEVCCWAKGSMAMPTSGGSLSPFMSKIVFPHLVSIDLSYTRIVDMSVFANCETVKYLRIVSNYGITSVPSGLKNLVTFEAERCFTLTDIHTGLSGLPHLELISIDEAFRVHRLPTRLPALVQLNISRADGIHHEEDVNGTTFANPDNYPALEELFIHGQRSIKHLCPKGDAPSQPVLPTLQILVASGSDVEDLHVSLCNHQRLSRLTLGPQCTAIPEGLTSLKELYMADCPKITTLAPIIGSTVLEVLDISRTDGLPSLAEGVAADVSVPIDGMDGGGGDMMSALARGVSLAEARRESDELAALANGEQAMPQDASSEGHIVPAAEPPNLEGYPILPCLTTFIAAGASITSLLPLTNSYYLTHLDISATKHIKHIPKGLYSLGTLKASYSQLEELEEMEASNTLKVLHIAYTDSLKLLPQMPAIEYINDHKANFFLKMYVVSNLQKRGMMLLAADRDSRQGARHMDPTV